MLSEVAGIDTQVGGSRRLEEQRGWRARGRGGAARVKGGSRRSSTYRHKRRRAGCVSSVAAGGGGVNRWIGCGSGTTDIKIESCLWVNRERRLYSCVACWRSA